MYKTFMSLFLCFTTSMLIAQTQDISDQELQKFGDAFQQVRMLNQNSQQEMIKALEAEGISVDRFNAINQAEQNPNKEVEASDDELKKYESAMASIEEIQSDIQMQMKSKMKEAGIKFERYQQIMTMLQTDKELQQRLAQLMQG